MTPVSTICPPYITTTRSVTSATSARSCETRIEREAEFGPQPQQQLDDLRLHGDVERGGRLVGDDQLGVARQRHRDEHALPLAAGQLVRVGATASARGPGPTSSSSSAGVRLPPRRMTCLSWARTVIAGLSERQRVLVDHRHVVAEQPPPRPARTSSAGPGRRSGSRRRPARSRGCRPMTVSAVSDLPQPDSPTSPSTSPGPDVEARCRRRCPRRRAGRRTRWPGPSTAQDGVRRPAAAGPVRRAGARPRRVRAARSPRRRPARACSSASPAAGAAGRDGRPARPRRRRRPRRGCSAPAR